MPSRTQVAKYLASELKSGATSRKELINTVGGWLKATGQTKDIEHLVQSVSDALEDEGYIFAKVYTATELNERLKTQVEKFIKSTFSAIYVEAEYIIDRKLIGGIKIQTASGTLDDSVAGKLNRMLENIA